MKESLGARDVPPYAVCCLRMERGEDGSFEETVAPAQMESSGVVLNLFRPYWLFMAVRLSTGFTLVFSALCSEVLVGISSNFSGFLPSASLPSSFDSSTASPSVLAVRECCPAESVMSLTL
jgi:hypothetical protein